MKKLLTLAAASLMIAGLTMDAASARHRHYSHHGFGFFKLRASNAELRGNNANSASGSNSLANPNNTSGPH